MGKASSAKKVARAARTGGNRRPGQRRNLGFPLLIAGIIIAGTSLVLFARESREANAAPVSQASDPEGYDHWHAAFGVYDCSQFIFDGSPTGGAFFTDASGDPLGIHTHGDGVIHIHPFLDSAGGRNARMQLWFDDVGLQVSDDSITFPDGTVWNESEKQCGTGEDAKPGRIVIGRWADAQDAADGERPNELFTEDFGSIRFRNDREYYTIAFVSEDAETDLPVRDAIMDTLNNLSDVPPDQNIEAPTATTVTGSTDTTVAGGTDTTSVGGSDTTVAGSTDTTAAPAGDTTATTSG